MKAYRITTLFSGRGGEEEEEKGKGVLLYSGKARHTITPLTTSRIVGVRIYPLTLAMALAQHLVRWGGKKEVKGVCFCYPAAP